MIMNSIIQTAPNTKPYQNGLRLLPKWVKQQSELEQTENIPAEDEDFISRVLIDVLKYPDKKLSQLHRLSHRLGKHDLKSYKKKKTKNTQQINGKQYNSYEDSRENIFTQGSLNDIQPYQQHTHINQSSEICNCCGFTKQTQEISICQSFQEFPIVGLSTFLYFRTIINLIIMLLLLFLVYGAFACFANYYIFASSKNLSLLSGLSQILSNYNTIFSYKSIEANYTSFEDTITLFTRIGAGLIIVMMILWSILVYVFKHHQVENAQMIDDESVTASDFSVMIQDAPMDLFKDFNYISSQFAQYFSQVSPILQRQYFQIYVDKNKLMSSSVNEELQKLQVSKINIGLPFYLNQNNLQDDEEYEKLQQTLNDHKEKLIQWVNEFLAQKKLTVKVQRRQKRLQDYKDTQQKILLRKQSFLKNLQNQQKSISSQNEMKTTVFITFSTALCAKIVYQLNENNFLSKFSCCKNDRTMKIKAKNNKIIDLNIERAPQPQDIVWQSIGFSFWKILSRRFLTYFVTAAILTGSFFLITLLSKIQLESGSTIISILISGFISILNVAIGFVIHFLTVFQKDITKTNYQASLALKTVFARLVNSIIIPVIVKQDNVYGKSGLVEDIFFLGLTTSLLDPILKLLDFYYLFTLVKYWYQSKPYNKIGMDQLEMNKIAQKLEFEVGSQYIYVTNLFLITCFFTPLQPIIPIFSIIGLILMYWVQKYCLLNRMKRPIPGSDMINTALGQVITLGPIMLATGTLVFSDLLSQHGDRNLKFLLHLIAIGIGGLFYLLPFKTIYKMIYSQDEKFVNLNYFQSRILLRSEYDRINPATAKQGMKDFIKYMNQVDEICAHGHQNHHNQTHNNKLVQNLAKFFKKSNQNPQMKINQNLQNSLLKKPSNAQNAPINKNTSTNKNVKKIQPQKNAEKPKEVPFNQKQNELKNQNKVNKPQESLKKNSMPAKKTQYLRQRKKNSMNQGLSPNFAKGPNLKQIERNQKSQEISRQKQQIPKKNPYLNIQRTNDPKKSQFDDLQEEILQNWPTKESQKIKIPTKDKNQDKDEYKPYFQNNDQKVSQQQKPPGNRKTQKFNFMKMKTTNNRSNQDAENSNNNTFALLQMKPTQNQYQFNIKPTKQTGRKRSNHTQRNANSMMVDAPNYEPIINRGSKQTDNNAFHKQRYSLPYCNERNEFENKTLQLNQNNKMSMPSQKTVKLKSKLFNPSTRKKTNDYDDEDDVNFY